jgi:isopenicillin N synthase-like dioxygenase
VNACTEVLTHYGDPSPLGSSQWATSVFNIYRYFNTPETIAATNCIEHIDPGFITVLARSPVVGLEVYEAPDRWTRIEEFMEHDELVVIVGETLERMTAKRYVILS